MKISYHKRFRNGFQKLPGQIQDKFFERLDLFQNSPFHPTLNNHAVESAYPKWRSINITGDYRTLFEITEQGMVVFMKIGTHSELYG